MEDKGKVMAERVLQGTEDYKEAWNRRVQDNSESFRDRNGCNRAYRVCDKHDKAAAVLKTTRKKDSKWQKKKR